MTSAHEMVRGRVSPPKIRGPEKREQSSITFPGGKGGRGSSNRWIGVMPGSMGLLKRQNGPGKKGKFANVGAP